jgi:hypothetical protein
VDKRYDPMGAEELILMCISEESLQALFVKLIVELDVSLNTSQ